MDRVFYIFRHGETDWNKDRRCQGHTNIPLNETGINQARQLAMKMQSIPLEIIYSSDLERAQKTGLTVAEELKIPIHFDSRLREMSYGEAEGMMFQEAIEKFGPDLWEKLQSFKKENDHVGFPGGETRLAARSRFESMLSEIIKETNFKVVGLSTHGGALRNLLQSFLPETHPIIPIPNCVVYRFRYQAKNNSFEVDIDPI